jgi:hypothetical protein
VRRLDWPAIVLGACAVLPARFVLGLLVALSPVGSLDVSASFLAEAAAGFFAFGLGGCVAGLVAGRSGGLNGLAASLLGGLLAGGAGLAVATLILVMAPAGSVAVGRFEKGDSVQGSSAAGMPEIGTIWALSVASVVLPLAGGYLGGRLGERLRGRSAP